MKDEQQCSTGEAFPTSKDVSTALESELLNLTSLEVQDLLEKLRIPFGLLSSAEARLVIVEQQEIERGGGTSEVEVRAEGFLVLKVDEGGEDLSFRQDVVNVDMASTDEGHVFEVEVLYYAYLSGARVTSTEIGQWTILN